MQKEPEGESRMKKHRILPVILIVVLVVTVLCGTVLAYMFRQTEYEDNYFTPAGVSCKVQEKTDSPLTKKTSIKVQNTGNIDAYLRVRLVSYWVGADGNIVAKPSSVPEITPAEGWIKGTNDTYYYQSPISPENSTKELLSAPIVLAEDENGYLQVVEVFAEAIQSKPENAVTDSWNVSLDEAGRITDGHFK